MKTLIIESIKDITIAIALGVIGLYIINLHTEINILKQDLKNHEYWIRETLKHTTK